MASKATKAANDPQLLPYPLKEGWWAMAMIKSQLPTVHRVHNKREPGITTASTYQSTTYVTLYVLYVIVLHYIYKVIQARR